MDEGYTRMVIDVQFKFGISMSSKSGNNSAASHSSTECDSDREEPRVVKTNVLKHKTELCKNFSEKGYCNYREKCRFAHGREELVRAPAKEHYREKKCQGFWKHGCCKYGIRCQFGHAALSWDRTAALLGLQATINPPLCKLSKLTLLLSC